MLKTMNKAGASTLLVTPKIEAFLMEHPDGVIWDEDGWALFRQIVEATFGTNDDRSGRFGPSAIGSCQRQQIWKYIGMPSTKVIDLDLMNLFNDGKWRHIRWQMMGVQSGALTHAEYPLSMPKYRLRSSADGLNSVDAFIFELKGDRNMSRLLNEQDGVVDKHFKQIHTMLLMTGWDLASYLMEDKATQQFREIVVHRDPKIIREVRTELEELNEHVENRTLPVPLPACQAKEGPYRSCPFAKPCIERWNGGRGGDYWPDERDWSS